MRTCIKCYSVTSTGQWYKLNNKYLCNRCHSNLWYNNNKETVLLKMKKSYHDNHEFYLRKNRQNYKKHRKKRLQAKKIYAKNNYTKILKYQRLYKRTRLHNDITYRLESNLRGRIRTEIHLGLLNKKPGKLREYLGCSSLFFTKYVESLFASCMTWNNYGTLWQLDHIKPLCSFNLNKKSEFLKATHYTNIQPLSLKNHYKKTAKEIRLYRGKHHVK